MSDKSAIEWTDATWNPVRGCTKVSPGCANCYAETFAERWRGVPNHPYTQGFDLRLVPEKLDEPLKWKTGKRIFVNSMSDLFQDGVPDAFIDQVFAVMALTPRHTFQLLTKRAERMCEYMTRLPKPRIVTALEGMGYPAEGLKLATAERDGGWPLPNVWLGVSVENQGFADERIPLLLQTPAAKRFISAEPLLAAVDLGLTTATCNCCTHFPSRWVSLTKPVTCDFPLALLPENRNRIARTGCYRTESNAHGALSIGTIAGGLGLRPSEFNALPALDWVIVGGESGHGSRQFNLEWARSIVRQCKAADVPVFVKQFGSVPVMADTDWRKLNPAPLLSARNHRKVNVDVVPLAFSKKGGLIAEWPEDLRVREFPTARTA